MLVPLNSVTFDPVIIVDVNVLDTSSLVSLRNNKNCVLFMVLIGTLNYKVCD